MCKQVRGLVTMDGASASSAHTGSGPGSASASASGKAPRNAKGRGVHRVERAVVYNPRDMGHASRSLLRGMGLLEAADVHAASVQMAKLAGLHSIVHTHSTNLAHLHTACWSSRPCEDGGFGCALLQRAPTTMTTAAHSNHMMTRSCARYRC